MGTARRQRASRARWALLAWLVAATLGCRGVVRGGLAEGQANELLVALDAAGIGATKVEESGALAGRYRVEVAQSSLARALKSLHERKLPRPGEAGFAELYGDTGLVPTPHDERARWLAATSGELARSLGRLPGVVDARVHLAKEVAPRALDAAPPPHKASVLLRVAAGVKTIDDAGVRRLVSGAVDGLQAAQVDVVRVPVATPVARGVSLIQVGPAYVSAASAPGLRALLAGTFALDILMAAALIVIWRRARRA